MTQRTLLGSIILPGLALGLATTAFAAAPMELSVIDRAVADFTGAGVGEPGVPPFAPALTNAIFAATSDDEHAVSIAIDGPVSANVNDARPGTTLPKLAAAASAEGDH